MSAFTIFERYENAVKLWQFVSPNIPVPPREQIVFWLSRYTDEQLEKGFLHVPSRFRNRVPIAPEQAYALVHEYLRYLNMHKGREGAR